MDENSISPGEPFSVGEWVVDPDSGRIRQGNQEVKLEPKAMAVLVYLAQQPNKVVSREVLEDTIWAGTVVGYDALSNSIIKLRKALGDDRRNPRYIETVSKKGYRLVAEVGAKPGDEQSTEAVSPGRHESATHPHPGGQFPKRNFIFVGAAVLAAVAIAAMLFMYSFGNRPATDVLVSNDTRPAIVVLPLKNLSDDPKQDYFSDGITDDLITDLSRVDVLQVVARQSSYYYKDQDVSLNKVAKDLGVKYILAGSVRKSGDKIRINVQLTNIATGRTEWAERFDRTSANFFGTQDQITRKIVAAMSEEISGRKLDRKKLRSTNNFAAYENFLLGQKFTARRTKLDYEKAVDAYKEAIRLDPNYARAYGALAVSISFAFRYGWSDLAPNEAQARALELTNKAYELDPDSPEVNWSLGFVHLFRKEYALAEEAAKRSVELSPSYADGYGLLAFVSNLRGQSANAKRYIQKAIELNPFYTFAYPWNLGLANYYLGEYDKAIPALKDALERNDNALWARLYLAASYVRLGRMDDAKWEIETVKILFPDTTLSNFSVALPLERAEQRDMILKDLRAAGLRE